MSTNNKIWEENKNILPNQINYKHEEIDKCDITNETNLSVEKNLLNDITQKKSGIYKIVNKINGKYYVGSSKDVKHRWNDHIRDLRKNNHHNDYLQAAWNKYGEQSFEFQFIESVNEDELLLVEQKYLDELKTQQHMCYNLNFYAHKIVLTEYSRLKMSQKLKGKLSGINNPMFGLKGNNHPAYGNRHTHETKNNISKLKKGVKNHKLRNNKNRLGIKHSVEIKKKLSILFTGEKNPRYGEKLDEKTKSKISEKLKCMYKSGELVSNCNKNIYSFFNTTKNIHRTYKAIDLYKEFGLVQSGVSQLTSGKISSYKGWVILK
jgi:group I intron endonuclease